VATVGPGVVVEGEVGAVLDGGMAEFQNSMKGWGRIFKPGFAEMVEAETAVCWGSATMP